MSNEQASMHFSSCKTEVHGRKEIAQRVGLWMLETQSVLVSRTGKSLWFVLASSKALLGGSEKALLLAVTPAFCFVFVLLSPPCRTQV